MPELDYYRHLEGDSTNVARPRTKASLLIPLVLAAGVVGLFGLNAYNKAHPPVRSMTDADKEEFQTRAVQFDQMSRKPASTDPGIIVVPPEAPAPSAPPAAPPSALPPPPGPETAQAPASEPVAPGLRDDSEARRLAEEERMRREAAEAARKEEERRWARFRAPMLVRNDSGGVGTDAAQARTTDADARDDDPNRRFLASSGSAMFDVSEATQNKRIDALVPQGTIIQAVLDNAVQSDLPGMVRATVKEDVYSFDGRRVLIPSGSRLIGDYKSGLATGQTRVFIVWTRLLRSDGVSVQLGSIGGDALGRAGVTGFVDEHYVERFGSAILLSIAGAGAQYMSSIGTQSYGGYGGYYGTGNTVSTTDPTTGVVTTTTSPYTSSQQNSMATQLAAQTAGQSMNNIAQMALRNSINIPPTIYLDQGSAVTVFVRKDLNFSKFYPDPVKEALREIKNERRSASNRIYK